MAPVNTQLNNVQGMYLLFENPNPIYLLVSLSPLCSFRSLGRKRKRTPSSMFGKYPDNERQNPQLKISICFCRIPKTEQVKNVLHDLFQIMTQISHYDSAGRPSRDSLIQDLITLQSSLQKVYTEAELLPPPPDPSVVTTTTPSSSATGSGYIGIPLPLIQYVEDGRNPDIYTREFVELVRRMNQLAKGKNYAFRNFRDVLAHEMDSALPELRDDVRRVLEQTGGLHTADFTLRPGGAQSQGQSRTGPVGGGSLNNSGDGASSHQGGPMNMGGGGGGGAA